MGRRETMVRWAPRLHPSKLQRLYALDAQGLRDDDLLNEVGYTLYSRCRSILQVSEAMHGRVHCPQCDTIIPRASDGSDELLHCPTCGWEMTLAAYTRSYSGRELGAGGAVAFFEAFVAAWEQARGPRSKMLAIDQLIHRWHWEEARQRPSFGLGRPTGLNLIEGNRQQVLAFLDTLTYGADSTPGLAATKAAWREHRHELQRRRDAGQTPPTDAGEAQSSDEPEA
jgi:ribosomal protein L37AE/L43A